MGGKDNSYQQQLAPTTELVHCSSCNRSQKAEFFIAGKLACDACLKERREKRQKKGGERTLLEQDRNGQWQEQQVNQSCLVPSTLSLLEQYLAATIANEEAQT